MGPSSKDRRRRMSKQKKSDRGEQAVGEPSSPGSETERFRAIVDVTHNEAVTGESGVPANQRDHELRRQMRSLEEFS
jgi:hypothetical protein